MPANRMAVLALLTQLQNTTIEISQLERIIQEDLSLGSQVLRYINSAFFEMPKHIDSIIKPSIWSGPIAFACGPVC